MLGSGSAGNSALVATEHCKILVDGGLSARQVVLRLEQCGITPEQLASNCCDGTIELCYRNGPAQAGRNRRINKIGRSVAARSLKCHDSPWPPLGAQACSRGFSFHSIGPTSPSRRLVWRRQLLVRPRTNSISRSFTSRSRSAVSTRRRGRVRVEPDEVDDVALVVDDEDRLHRAVGRGSAGGRASRRRIRPRPARDRAECQGNVRRSSVSPPASARGTRPRRAAGAPRPARISAGARRRSDGRAGRSSGPSGRPAGRGARPIAGRTSGGSS